MKKLIGQVTPDERNEIQTLFERKNGLAELSQILTADNAELYEKLVTDMGQTDTKFRLWWDTMSRQYQWESAPDGHWEIDFEACSIYLVTPDDV